jgi:hypothetical protein
VTHEPTVSPKSHLARIADFLEAHGRDEGGYSEETRREFAEDAALVRSLVSGQRVVVDRAELEDARSLLEMAGDPNFYTHKGAVNTMKLAIDRWLSHSSQETPR